MSESTEFQTNTGEDQTMKPENTQEIEKQEEAKLAQRYPSAAAMAGRPMAGHSAFLQKRLAKGQKYFDSGDYQMAKQTGKGKPRMMTPLLSVAPEIPTPETVPSRKISLQQPSKLAQT